MGAEAGAFFSTLIWLAGLGLAAFVLRLVLAGLLRGRLAPDLLPEATGERAPLFFPRLLALAGMAGPVPETLGTRRLRATPGLKLAATALVLAMLALPAVPELPFLPWLLVLATGWIAVQVWIYEIAFDRDTITLPRWWFGRSTRRWRDLDQVVTRDPFTMELHFRDGQVIRAHKYVVGYPLLMEVARKAMREV